MAGQELRTRLAEETRFMSPVSVIFLLIACVVVLLGMLVATGLARRLDRGEASRDTSRLWTLLQSSADTPAGRIVRSLTSVATADAQEEDPQDASASVKKKANTVVGVLAGFAAILVVVGALMDFTGRDMTPVETEMAAGELHGAMLSRGGDDPVVLIIPGSGPVDRDGNSPAGLSANAYRLLAEGLAAEGIASVRVDKSGMFSSAGAGDPNAASPGSYVRDYHAWIDAIRAQRGAECVWLLGHSEGALMASLAAAGRSDVCGLILVAGMGRRMADIMRQQLADNPANAPVLEPALGAIRELEAGRHVETAGMHPALASLFAPQVQDFLIRMFAIDPVEAVRRSGHKVLIIQGDRDLQVSAEDARLLNKAPRTRLRIIKGMNHVLKDAPADRAGNFATYADPSLPLAGGLVKPIRDFIKAD